MTLVLTSLLAATAAGCGSAGDGPTQQAAQARVWYPMTVSFRGPTSSETSSRPNPFLDFRLQVTFRGPRGRTYSVPGYFDGDGRGGSTGDTWRVRFTPDAPGRWTYRASFFTGPNAAVTGTGRATAFHGATGRFRAAPGLKKAPGFHRWGRLEYVRGHYLKFRAGPHWIKGGVDEPENFLAYAGFDGTKGTRFPLHQYAPHVRDWRAGDPTWGNGQGKGIVGALNYLSAQKINSIYFLAMNIGGDGQDTWPFAGDPVPGGSQSNDNLHYDLSKLRQWEVVFRHAQRKGIALHIVLNEAEPPNKRELDGGELGIERKLFYRELVARFAHHNALQWNISEEYDLGFDLGPSRVRQFAGFLQAADPYDHPITVHSLANPRFAWTPFLGDRRFTVTSFQDVGGTGDRGRWVEEFRARSKQARWPLVVSLDELRAATTRNIVSHRREIVWPTYMSGGQLEHYFEPHLRTEDFRPLEGLWRATWHARKFVSSLPFWQMEPNDGLVTSATTDAGHAQALARPGHVYAVYLPRADGSGVLDLTRAAGRFEKRWYDPTSGRYEARTVINGGSRVALGRPPSRVGEDWALVFKRSA